MKNQKSYQPLAPQGQSAKKGKKSRSVRSDQAVQNEQLETKQAQLQRPVSIEAVHRFGKTSGST